MSTNDNQSFLKALDLDYCWPDFYQFKFLIEKNRADDLMQAVTDLTQTKSIDKIEKIASTKEKYLSVRFRLYAESSQDIAEVYDKLEKYKSILKI